jgi:hypothetical protein
MAAKKAKGSSFSKSSTKAGTAAYNTKNKVRIAKEALAKKNKEIEQANKYIKDNLKYYRTAKTASAQKEFGARVEYGVNVKKERTAAKGKISQAVSDRSRSATRAAGIAKRVAKKGKK